jgi:hypothetical protein
MALGEQFKALQVKDVTPEQHAGHVQNIVDSVNAATPSERRAGARFYPRAHRDAYHVGQRMNPGHQTYGGKGAERPGHARMTGTQALAHASDPRASDAATARGAGAIAALSPSSPAGMDWENNPTAAYEAWGLTTEQVGHFRAAETSLGKVSKAVGDARAAKNHGDPGAIRDATAHSARMGADYKALSDTARQAMPAGSSLNHAGNRAILKAHEILAGEKTPEQVLPMDAKTGHFYRAIKGDSDAAVVDGRSHDLTTGQHLQWDTPRGLSAKGRYKYFADTHTEARNVLGMRSTSAVQATSWIQDKNAMLAKATPALRALGRAGNSMLNVRGS